MLDPTSLFAVREGIDVESALDRASCLLAEAIGCLAAADDPPEHLHAAATLTVMAKSLIDTSLERALRKD